MITQLKELPHNIIGFSFQHTVCHEDYRDVLIPAIDQQENRPHKMICLFGEEFTGYSLGAAWDDLQLATKNWHAFQAIALVTDVVWLRRSCQAISPILPFPLRLFNNNQYQQAIQWLTDHEIV